MSCCAGMSGRMRGKGLPWATGNPIVAGTACPASPDLWRRSVGVASVLLVILLATTIVVMTFAVGPMMYVLWSREGMP